MYDSRTLIASREEIIGIFTIHLTEWIENTRYSIISKLSALEGYLIIHAKEENRNKAKDVRALIDKLRNQISYYSQLKEIEVSKGDIQLKKQLEESLKVDDILEAVKPIMEQKIQEERKMPTGNALKMVVRTDFIAENMVIPLHSVVEIIRE